MTEGSTWKGLVMYDRGQHNMQVCDVSTPVLPVVWCIMTEHSTRWERCQYTCTTNSLVYYNRGQHNAWDKCFPE